MLVQTSAPAQQTLSAPYPSSSSNNDVDKTTSTRASLYRQAILRTCQDAAYGPSSKELAKAMLSYLKDDSLRSCCGSARPTSTSENLCPFSDITARMDHLGRILPDPELQHPVSQRVVDEVIQFFGNSDPYKGAPYQATVAVIASNRCKVLMDTICSAHEIPRPQGELAKSNDNLAAAFMRSSGSGPLDDASLFVDDEIYNWVSQYVAAKSLSGLGKRDDGISFREEMKKHPEAMHSTTAVGRTVVTDAEAREDPFLRKQLYAFTEGWVADTDWSELEILSPAANHTDGDHDNDRRMTLARCFRHGEIGIRAENAVAAYEKICVTQREARAALQYPGWICALEDLEERHQLLAAHSYGDYGVDSESHASLVRDEGIRTRARLMNLVVTSAFDSYDEWTAGLTNVASALCSDCARTEFQRACAPEHWNSEVNDYFDRVGYGACLYYVFSARHNQTLARFLRFNADAVKVVLAKYGYQLQSGSINSSCRKRQGMENTLSAIADAIGVQIPNDDLQNQIAFGYDWDKISGLCESCIESGAGEDWYLATIGICFSARHLPLLEQVRLAHYLDSAGLNAFPALFHSYIHQCACLGRWAKRLIMVAFQVSCSGPWTVGGFSATIALRDAMADMVQGLDDGEIVIMLGKVEEEVQRGRQLGREYRQQQQELIMGRVAGEAK
ncbi:hypothetical protein BG003_011052 [Podila horticola]|nr:hypothetical protein BG003_011052 [Podila horticola]